MAPSEAAPCARCGASLGRPAGQASVPEPPAVRAPTNRGEQAQRAAGVVAESLPKAPPRPRPAPPTIAPALPRPETQPGGGPPPAPSWPPPPAQWEPHGARAWPPPPDPAGWAPPPPPDAIRQAEPPGGTLPRPRTGWSRPSWAWWDRLVGAPAVGTYVGTTPPTYFWQALVCVVLFPPTGLAAVVYSLLVSRRAETGDGAGSARASHLARVWCIVTVIVFAVGLVVSLAAGLKA